MPHYQAPDRSVHFLDSSDFEYLLPPGSVQINEQEADAILNPPPTLAELIAAKHKSILDSCEAEIAAIKAGYPDSEVLSWSKQETEARAWQADNAAATPLLDALANARGINKADLVTRVIAKADLFAEISGTLIGKRQALEDQLAALPADATAEDVEAIQW